MDRYMGVGAHASSRRLGVVGPRPCCGAGGGDCGAEFGDWRASTFGVREGWSWR